MMPKFIYKFESIKKIKEILEKQVQKEISQLEKDIQNKNCRLKDLTDEIEKTKSSLAGRKNIKAAELQFVNDVEYLLVLDAKKIRMEIENLESKKTAKLSELLEKTKEHKMFETLEGKYQEDFISEQNLIEQKDIDEMAVTKYIREE